MTKNKFQYPSLVPLSVPAGWYIPFHNRFVDEEPVDDGRGQTSNFYGFNDDLLFITPIKIDANNQVYLSKTSADYSIELDWYPEFSVNGCYVLKILDTPREVGYVFEYEHKNRYEIRDIIDFSLSYLQFSKIIPENFIELATDVNFRLQHFKAHKKLCALAFHPYCLVLENDLYEDGTSDIQEGLIIWISHRRDLIFKKDDIFGIQEVKVYKNVDSFYYLELWSNHVLDFSCQFDDVEKVLKAIDYCMACVSLYRRSDLEGFINKLM